MCVDTVLQCIHAPFLLYAMVERLPTCGNCRRPNVGHVPSVVLETDKEMDEDDENARMDGLRQQIDLYRRECRHLDTQGSFLYHLLPYRIDTSTVFPLTLFSDRTMYVHSVVELPIEPTREVRVAVYTLCCV